MEGAKAIWTDLELDFSFNEDARIWMIREGDYYIIGRSNAVRRDAAVLRGGGVYDRNGGYQATHPPDTTMRMLNLSCHCGQIRVQTSKQPDYIHECNCTFCRKSGARWGYFHPSEVSVEGAAEGYCREDKADPAALIQFCAKCGSTTHFVLTESAVAKHGNVVMGINMRLADERDLAGIELRYPDGRAWSGEGAFGYVREPRLIGQSANSD